MESERKGVIPHNKAGKRWVPFIFLIFFFFLNMAEYGQAVVLRGVVTLQNSGNEPINDVQIFADGAAPVVFTNDLGHFELRLDDMEAGGHVFLCVKKSGRQVVRCWELEIIPRAMGHEPIRIVMCCPRVMKEQLEKYRRIITDTIAENFEEEKERIEKQKIDDTEKRIRIIKLMARRDAAYRQSLETAKRLAEVNLDDVSELYGNAIRYFRRNQAKRAVALIESPDLVGGLLETADLRSNFVKLQLLKARLYTMVLDFEQAEKSYDLALRADPDDVDIISEVAFYFLKQNNLERAGELYEDALRRVRNRKIRADICFHLGYVYNAEYRLDDALGAVEEAREIYEGLVKRNRRVYLPDIAETFYNLGMLNREKKRYETAVILYKQAQKYYNELDTVEGQSYTHFIANTLNRLGEIFNVTDTFEEALSAHKEALEIYKKLQRYPKIPEIEHAAAETHNYLGDVYVKANKLAEAKDAYGKALKIWKRLAKDDPRFRMSVVRADNKLSSLLGNGTLSLK